MARLSEPIRYLDREEMKKIHAAAVEILETVGMVIDSHEALDVLETAGCKVDRDRKLVMFSADLVDNCVNKMRERATAAAAPSFWMPVRYSRVFFTTMPRRVHGDFTTSAGGFVPFIYDLEGQRRYANIDDVRASIRLADALDNIDLMGLPCSAQEVPAALRPVAMAAELVKNTRKIGGVETFTAFDVEYVTRIAEVAAGSAEALRAGPKLIGYAEVRSPLTLDANMAEVFIAYVKRGIPQSLDTMPDGGATAPVTAAGILAQGIAESLGGLVLGYAIDPEAVLRIDVCPSFCDMQSGIFRYASPERMPLIASIVQMLGEYYGCYGGTHGGKTDACFPGVQAGLEKMMTTLIPVLAGAVGIGTVGHLENAITFSPAQLVIDNEIARAVRGVVEGFEVSDETLAVEVIREVGPGGNFLAHEHTASHFREEMFLSSILDRMPWSTAHDQKVRTTEEKAAAAARELSARETEPPLTSDQEREIDNIVAEAEAKLREKGRI